MAEYPDAGFESLSLNSAEFESLEINNPYLYATTPPNHRAQIRVKGKEKSFRAKVFHATKLATEKQEQESSRKASIPLRFLELGNEDMSDSDLIGGDASVSPSTNDINSRRKKETQRRNVDRSLKMGLNPYSETEPSGAAAAESMTVDTASRFQCVHQTLATKRVADNVPFKFKMPTMHLSPSFTGLKIPKDRFDFHHTFTMLISLGNTSQKKDISDKYLRQRSSEQELWWRSNLSDMIWLELQARLNGRSVEDQDRLLGAARQGIGKTLQRILDFRIASPAGDDGVTCFRSEYSEEMLKWCQMSCVRCGTCLREAILAQAAALKEITALLQELEAAESLFPTQKALALSKEHAVYTTPEFQQQLGTLCLWQNITIDIVRKLLLVAKIISIDLVESTPWSCVDLVVLERMAKIMQEQPTDCEEDISEKEEDNDDVDDEDEAEAEEDAEEEGQQSNSGELSVGAWKHQ